MIKQSPKLSEIHQSVSISAIVVTCNNVEYLRLCLESLAFCQQLLVVDLGSSDRSVEVARECGAEITHHGHVPVVEQVWPDILHLLRYDWILRADPDEVFPALLACDLMDTIAEDELTGAVSLPHQYYFRGRSLKTTRWGGAHYVCKVFHKDRVQLNPHVHRGILIKDGYHHNRVVAKNGNLVQHYWVDTWRELFEKHWRYVKQEGEARYKLGDRFSWPMFFKEIGKALWQNLINYKGLHGGTQEFFLSLFYAGYVGMSLLSLRKYQRDR